MNGAIHRAIEHLGELAELLQDEIVEQTVDQRLTPRGRASKEAMLTAEVLTAKLEAVIQAPGVGSRQLEIGNCATCNDQ